MKTTKNGRDTYSYACFVFMYLHKTKTALSKS